MKESSLPATPSPTPASLRLAPDELAEPDEAEEAGPGQDSVGAKGRYDVAKYSARLQGLVFYFLIMFEHGHKNICNDVKRTGSVEYMLQTCGQSETINRTFVIL